MGSIDQPPAVLGGMIGSALVGTFLGVLLAYGIVSPLASRLEQIVEEDGEIYHVAKAIIISSLFGNRSEEHTSELQSLMRLSYAVLCLKKKTSHECPFGHRDRKSQHMHSST